MEPNNEWIGSVVYVLRLGGGGFFFLQFATVPKKTIRNDKNESGTWSEFDPAMSKRFSYARIPTATNIALEETIDGATIRSVSHSAVTNTATYDAYRREMVRTDGRGNAMTNAYDTLGRLSSVTDPLGATTHYAYDAVGNLIAITNALGNATIYEYDIRGNKTYEGGATYPVRYTHDDFNVMTNMTTYRNESLQSGDTTTWLYDEPTGLLTNKVYADGKGPAYTYTIDGKLATRTWARGITTDYSYDGWGNLRNTVYSDGTPAILLFYDALGRQTEAHDAAGVTTFFYDMYGTLTNEAVRCTRGALAAWQGQETTNVVSSYYDSFGRNTGYAFNGVRQSTLSYYPVTGRLASMLANGSDTPFAWSYLPRSDLKSSLAYPNGLTASWTYDANNQLLQVCNAFSTNIISQYDYSYDAAGRRTEIARSGSAMSGNRTDSYGYNVRDELISATKTGGTASVPSTTEYAYQYDDIGNRISSFDLGANRTYTANALNQYLEISTSDARLQTLEFEPQYDDDGNQTLIQTSTGVWSVTYNGENRPVLWERIVSDSNTQTLVSMQFDRMGRRVSYLETFGSVTNSYKVFTYDGYLQIANSELTTQNSQRFIWDPTEPVATRPLVFYNSNASPQYYTHDGNKNVSGLADSTQSITAHYAYAPFGTLLFSSDFSSPTNPFRFSSEFADDALGLVYYNYRHYNPEIGRWMRRDPFSYYSGPNLVTFLSNKCIGAVDFLGLRGNDPPSAVVYEMGVIDAFKSEYYLNSKCRIDVISYGVSPVSDAFSIVQRTDVRGNIVRATTPGSGFYDEISLSPNSPPGFHLYYSERYVNYKDGENRGIKNNVRSTKKYKCDIKYAATCRRNDSTCVKYSLGFYSQRIIPGRTYGAEDIDARIFGLDYMDEEFSWSTPNRLRYRNAKFIPEANELSQYETFCEKFAESLDGSCVLEAQAMLLRGGIQRTRIRAYYE